MAVSNSLFDRMAIFASLPPNIPCQGIWTRGDQLLSNCPLPVSKLAGQRKLQGMEVAKIGAITGQVMAPHSPFRGSAKRQNLYFKPNWIFRAPWDVVTSPKVLKFGSADETKSVG